MVWFRIQSISAIQLFFIDIMLGGFVLAKTLEIKPERINTCLQLRRDNLTKTNLVPSASASKSDRILNKTA